MITLLRFRRLEAALRRRGYGPTIEWSENIQPPENADAFAREAIYVILSGGMKATVAVSIYHRCLEALHAGKSCATVFGHPGKRTAIDRIWNERQRLFAEYQQSPNPVAYLQTLPWVGPVLSLHLGKLLVAGDLAKPDIHLERLARREGTTTAKLCNRLARETGYRVATVDSVLWRACADGLLKSRVYESDGWSGAISREVTREAYHPSQEPSGETPLPQISVETD